MNVQNCSVEGCKRHYLCKGFCNLHYKRWKMGKDLSVPAIADRIPRKNGCLVAGCAQPVKQNGYCSRHYKRWRTGRPIEGPRRKGPKGTPTLRSDGYVKIRDETTGRVVFEHRLVWQRTHGPIPVGHHIHHRNGCRSDNRLENLELIERTQHVHLHHPTINSWSRHHAACCDCGTTERKHLAKGLCTTCYSRRYRSVAPDVS